MSTATTKEGIYQLVAYVDAVTFNKVIELTERQDRSRSYVVGQLVAQGIQQTPPPSFPNPTRRTPGKRISRSR